MKYIENILKYYENNIKPRCDTLWFFPKYFSAPAFPNFPQSDGQKWQHSGNGAVPPRWSAWPFYTNGYFSYSLAQLKGNWRLGEAGDIILESAYVISSISKRLSSKEAEPQRRKVCWQNLAIFFSFSRDLIVESKFFPAQKFFYT